MCLSYTVIESDVIHVLQLRLNGNLQHPEKCHVKITHTYRTCSGEALGFTLQSLSRSVYTACVCDVCVSVCVCVCVCLPS